MNNLATTDLETSTIPVLPWKEIERLIAHKMLDFQTTLAARDIGGSFNVYLHYSGRCQAKDSEGIKLEVNINCGEWNDRGEVADFNNVEIAMEECITRYNTNRRNKPKQLTHSSIGE